MALERFHARITVPAGEMDRILGRAWRESRASIPDHLRSQTRDEPIFVFLTEMREETSVYETGDPITEGFAYLLQFFGAQVERITKPRVLQIPPHPYLDETSRTSPKKPSSRQRGAQPNGPFPQSSRQKGGRAA